MPTMKKDPNEVQAAYDLELRKNAKVYEDKESEREKEVKLAEIELEKTKVHEPIVIQSKYKSIQRIFEIPLRMFGLFVVWRLVVKGKRVPEFLKKFI